MFSGLQPFFPTFLLVLLALLSLAVAYFSYNRLENSGSTKKWTLILLRSSSLLILILLLLNPLYTIEEIETESPAIAVYLDNSESITVQKGEYDGLTAYKSLIEEFRSGRDNRAGYEEYTFGNRVQSESDPDGSDGETRLNAVFEHITENEYRYKAAVLISDGINTAGRNPLFAASELSIPVITIPLGDTTTVKDVAISDVNISSPVFTNTVHPIRVEVQHQQIGDEQTEIRLLENGELIQSENISFSSGSGSQLVDFQLQYSEPGIRTLTIEAVPLEDEFTEENNRSTLTLDVQDNKTRILSLAFEIHPDVAAFRNLAASDAQNELVQANWLGGNRFSGTDLLASDTEEIETFDLAVLHGLPPAGSDIESRIADITSDIPIIFFTLPGSAGAESYQNIRPVSSQSIGSATEVRPSRISEDISHSLLELNIPAERTLPALTAFSGDYSVLPAAQRLLTANFQVTETGIPLLVADESTGHRIASVNAFGWYRYKINRQEEVSGFYEDLMTNLTSWAATASDDQNLTLKPAKNRFTESDEITIQAELKNERGEAEPNGMITLELSGLNGIDESRTFRMRHTNLGNYTANLGRLPEGVYRLEGEADVNSRNVGNDEIAIVVEQSNRELINTRRDDILLQQLAENSGGRFLNTFDISDFNRYLSDQDLLKVEEKMIRKNAYFHDYELLWFLLVLGLLTAEWLLRRSLSMV